MALAASAAADAVLSPALSLNSCLERRESLNGPSGILQDVVQAPSAGTLAHANLFIKHAGHHSCRSFHHRTGHSGLDGRNGSFCAYPRIAVKIPLKEIRSPVRVASACVVNVGFGPPRLLASAELSATNRRLSHRASQVASSTESSSLTPIRIVLWLWMTNGGLLIRQTLFAPSARSRRTACPTWN